MEEERVAIIDCGTNTFHLLIADVKHGSSNVIHAEKTTVRIGQGGISYGRINEEAAERAIGALSGFAEKIADSGVNRTLAFATSAFRSAGNGKQLTDRIARETGIHIQIIDGRREAELIYSGVRLALPDLSEVALIIDIGGGSVEFIIGKDDSVLWKESFEIGGQRMIDLFYEQDPIPRESVEELRNFLDVRLSTLYAAIREHRPTVLIGSSGSFETLSEMYMAEAGIEPVSDSELPLTFDAFEKLFEKLLTHPRKERLEIPGMVEMRVDMIVVASILIEHMLHIMQNTRIRVSVFALKEGVLGRLQQGKL